MNQKVKRVNTVTSTFVPGCVTTQHKNNITLLNFAASIMLLHAHAPADWAQLHQDPKQLIIPNRQTMTTTEMLTLQSPNHTCQNCLPDTSHPQQLRSCWHPL